MGNERLKERLRSELMEERLPHAYIIEGPRGSGKRTLAVLIAAALACERRTDENAPLPCGECNSCRKILSGNSPDVITVTREEKATLGVDAIRTMHNDVYIAPNDTENKVYLIEDAHTLTDQAQNAFLLILEEPPAYVRFFLLCNTAAPLLETVRSRAPTLRLEPIPAEDIGELLCQRESAAKALREQSPTEFRELLIAADGSVGRALRLLDPKQRKPILERRATAREFLDLCMSRRNSVGAVTFLNGLGQKREEIIPQLGEILICLRDLFLCKQTEQAPLCFFSDREEALELSCRFSAPELLRISTGLENAMTSLQANANVRLTLTAFAVEAGLFS